MQSRRIAVTILSIAATAILAAPAVSGAAVTGTSAWRERGAHELGPMKARTMTITLALAARNAAALKTFVTHPHAALTPSQFDARYAPTQATIAAIRSWAKSEGLTVRSVSADRLLVSLRGRSTAIGTALTTSFDTFESSASGQYFALARRASLPNALAPKVAAVLGLSSLGKLAVPEAVQRSSAGLNKVLVDAKSLLSSFGLAAPTLEYPGQYGPQGFWSLYNAPSSATGTGQQLAIVAEGNVSQPQKDLVTFEQEFGLPAVTWHQTNVGSPSSDTSGDAEWDLDSQYSTGFAPGVSQLDVYVAPSLADQDILATIDRWVTDDASKQGSLSAGECELLAYASGLTAGLDTVLEQADAQGQTMFFASGDTGSQCPALVGVNGVGAGVPGVNYPASSPYAIGVGGTSVVAPSGPTEITWYAAGGGSSILEPTPAFQSTTKVGGSAQILMRGVPDVSLDADPESGYEVVVDGAVEVIGGTSASTPSWQGIWARAEGAHRGTLGFAGPVIYNAEPAAAFHDITLGANGLYTALPGWDYASGRGTPNIAAFVHGA